MPRNRVPAIINTASFVVVGYVTIESLKRNFYPRNIASEEVPTSCYNYSASSLVYCVRWNLSWNTGKGRKSIFNLWKVLHKSFHFMYFPQLPMKYRLWRSPYQLRPKRLESKRVSVVTSQQPESLHWIFLYLGNTEFK